MYVHVERSNDAKTDLDTQCMNVCVCVCVCVCVFKELTCVYVRLCVCMYIVKPLGNGSFGTDMYVCMYVYQYVCRL
jgi:hypothetical protein